MLELTREQVAEVCSRNGITLSSDWDGVSEDVPVLIAMASLGYIGHMGSTIGFAKLSLIREYYDRVIFGDGVPSAGDGAYI